MKQVKAIGDEVRKDEIILYVDGVPVRASFDGVLRGLIREIEVTAREKDRRCRPQENQGVLLHDLR